MMEKEKEKEKKKNQTLSPHLRRPPEPVVQEAPASGITTAGRRRSGSPCCRRRDGGGEQEEDERPPWQSVRAHGDHLRLASELAGSLLVVSLTKLRTCLAAVAGAKLLYGGELLLLVILTPLYWPLVMALPEQDFPVAFISYFSLCKICPFFHGKSNIFPPFCHQYCHKFGGAQCQLQQRVFLLKNKLLRCNVCTTRMTLYDIICTLNSCCFNPSACSFCLWCSLCDV